MTTQEAIERLKGSYGFAKSYPSLTDKSGDSQLIINVEALGMAIEALVIYDEYKQLKELNTPKSPIVLETSDIKLCPICDNEITFCENYCDSCGQKIDWEAEE